jgi:hypothetical protein
MEPRRPCAPVLWTAMLARPLVSRTTVQKVADVTQMFGGVGPTPASCQRDNSWDDAAMPMQGRALLGPTIKEPRARGRGSLADSSLPEIRSKTGGDFLHGLP